MAVLCEVVDEQLVALVPLVGYFISRRSDNRELKPQLFQLLTPRGLKNRVVAASLLLVDPCSQAKTAENEVFRNIQAPMHLVIFN